VLYCPLKLIPVVRCTTIVTDSAVSELVFANFTSSSLKKPLLDATTGVTVTPPLPVPPPLATVRAIDVVRLNPPPVQVRVTVTGPPSVAVLEAASKSEMLFPVVEPGVKLAVTPLGNPLAVQETDEVKFVLVILIVLVPFEPRFTVNVFGLAATLKSEVAAAGVAET